MTALVIVIGILFAFVVIAYIQKKQNIPPHTKTENIAKSGNRYVPEGGSFLIEMRDESESLLTWDSTPVGDILIITFRGSLKRRAMAKADISTSDREQIRHAHVEVYDRGDESHKGVVAQQWKKIAEKVRNNPSLLNEMDASYLAILQEVANWTMFEKIRLKDAVVQDVPKRPGETLPTEFFEKLFDVPKVRKATTTSVHLATE